MNYSQEDNLLIQSYFTISFLTELKNLNFLNSAYYKEAVFKDTFVKDNFPQVGIDNQGSFLMIFYAMLVLPKQLIEKKFPEDFKKLNSKVDCLKTSATSTYKSDSDTIDYLRHIRNAIAHARVEFIPNTSVKFTDERNDEKCEIVISLSNIGEFLTELQKVFMLYIESLKKSIK